MHSVFLKEQKTPLLVCCVALLLLALHFFRPPAGGLWSQTFFDSLHVPVFGLIAVFIYLAAGTWSTWIARVLLALVAASILGMLSEFAQVFTFRDASWRDLVADCIGAISFLLILLAMRPPSRFLGRHRLLSASVAIVLLSWVMMPLAIVSAAYAKRYTEFPNIVRFDSPFGRLLTRAQNIDYRVVAGRNSRPAYALVTLLDKPWPGVAFHDVWPNWTNYATLTIDVAIEGDAPLSLHLRVHDEAHKARQEFTDRFNRSYLLAPGEHTLRIPLTDIANAPRGRLMDLTSVSELIVFGDASNAGRSFRLYEIRLE